MLSKLVDSLSTKTTNFGKMLHRRYKMSINSLSDQISMKPRDIWGRSLQAGNWSTLLVMAICYPTLLYFRGLDFHLLLGMVVHYASFWLIVVTLVTLIQVLWLINYCISQRFVENLLDFEILERVFGQDRAQGDDDDEFDLDEDISDNGGMIRAKG